MKAFAVTCVSPLLAAEFGAPQRMLSWSITRPGFVTARAVAWLQVSNADLPVGVDPSELLARRLSDAGHGDAVQLMTSRDVRKYCLTQARSGGVTAACLTTVGLANCGRVGEPPRAGARAGTINLLAHVDRALAEAAMIEVLSIAAEARTAAVIDLGWREDGKLVTGTGTDCIVVASPEGDNGECYAGLHTDVGAAIGRAVYEAVTRGGRQWIDERRGMA
ncbi:adenosylcobinamide amidohydrolase [Sinorhizobium sp. BG8]|uniref:adenosylcobinamide amidohydrolase n=1 Tax=Sinorhizobium sp. BG8 TaxID=2613773 RepID=UPI00193DB535|nr:adenosylcobinamide amidohydrolase [Sinorhizobium sp. BG8]QRM53720.1 adenosylcobinamide amidohydrolase [Sinorhizobium sp. BG8]